jgi:hypothetical protein
VKRLGHSKTRKAARDQAFVDAPKPKGRRPGALPLRKDARRFEAAMYCTLVRTRLRDRPILAAEFAASILHDQVIPTILNDRLSFEFTGGRGLRDDARNNRRDKILREAPGLIEGATGADRVWLEISVQTLHWIFNAIAMGEAEALYKLILILDQQGWRKPLRKLFMAQLNPGN